MTDQTPAYRPKPVTQRDSSPLATSNCRMAAIATGLDHETTGRKKSTGGTMRTFTSDQAGGTDSGDAKEAWQRGYAEKLRIEDGSEWSDVIAALREGRGVHLDVWHAAAGGPCLSGTGQYGHTLYVHPDSKNGQWLVADPWCSPPVFVYWPESELRQGAEEWGRRVFGVATAGPDLESPESAEEFQAIIGDAGRDLMTAFHPLRPDVFDDSANNGDTGGPQPILFTSTRPMPLEGESMGVRVNIGEAFVGTAKVKGPNHVAVQLADGDVFGLPDGQERDVYALGELAEPWTTPGGTTFPAGEPIVLIGTEAAFILERDVTLTDTAADYVPVGELYVKK